jgi:hypothetical protein
MMPIFLTTIATLGSALRKASLALFRFLAGQIVGPLRYRPEAHYMRGPGPKWREKYLQDHPARW